MNETKLKFFGLTKATSTTPATSAVMLAVALCSVPGIATAAGGGTIYFSGAIVAPQLQIAMASPASPAVAATGDRRGAPAVTLSFTAPPGVASGADVALMADDGVASRSGATALDTIAARFVDSAGRSLAMSSNGHFRIGDNGGVLTLTARNSRDAPSASKPVTVVINYD